jgi:transcription antitermination protein NusB
MSPPARIRKVAFQVLRSRPREVAFQILYQEDLQPDVDPAAAENLLHDRLVVREFLEFGRDDFIHVDGEEDFAAEPSAPVKFRREELLAFAAQHIPGFSPEELAALSRDELARLIRSEAVAFAQRLVTGVRGRRAELDAMIQQVAENWTLSRMAATDRNVLRLGAYELLHSDTPERVAVDEAVELAKRFGSAQSGPFVNGILDRLLRQKAERGESEG